MEHHQAAAILASERYILEELTAAEREAFEEHYFTCAICAQEVKDLSVLKVAWKDAPPQRRLAQERNVDERAGRKQGRFSWSWWLRPQFAFLVPCALAAAVLGAVWQMNQKSEAIEPQVIAAVMLRPESRGEVTTLSPGQSGPFVLLECDVPLEARSISWELRRAGSDEILRHGVAKAPEPGATLKLLIPSSVLPSAEYILRIESIGGESSASKRSSMYRLRIN